MSVAHSSVSASLMRERSEAPLLRGPGLSTLRIPSHWPSQHSLFAAAIQQASRARLLGVKLLPDEPESLRRFDTSNFGLLAAYTYPQATRERLEVCNDWHAWLFFFDDIADEVSEVGQRPAHLEQLMVACVEVLRGAPLRAGATALEHYTLDIRERLRRFASDAWLARFADDVDLYLFRGTLPAAHHWASGTVPDFDAYYTQRALDSAVFTALDLIEITVEGRELPEQVLVHDDLQRMRELCTRVVALSNDLFSYEKEVLWHQNPNNLVHMLQVHLSMSLEDAVAEAIQVINKDVERFLVCEERLRESGWLEDSRVTYYVDGMKSWMRGNVTWSLVSGRYCSCTSPFPQMRYP